MSKFAILLCTEFRPDDGRLGLTVEYDDLQFNPNFEN